MYTKEQLIKDLGRAQSRSLRSREKAVACTEYDLISIGYESADISYMTLALCSNPEDMLVSAENQDVLLERLETQCQVKQ